MTGKKQGRDRLSTWREYLCAQDCRNVASAVEVHGARADGVEENAQHISVSLVVLIIVGNGERELSTAGIIQQNRGGRRLTAWWTQHAQLEHTPFSLVVLVVVVREGKTATERNSSKVMTKGEVADGE